MLNKILEVKDLNICFPHRNNLNAVRHLNFTLEKGKTLGIVGESGSGKSLTALATMQLLPQGAYLGKTSKILYQNQDLLQQTEKKMRAIRGKKIALIFQEALVACNPVLTIGEQLTETIKKNTQSKNNNVFDKACFLLEEVGIENPKQCFFSYPFELSGGMQQRCLIAMAIAGEPEILIADEPTTALDVIIQAQIIELLQKIQKEHKMSMIFISHDLAIVSQIADEILLLKKGQLIESGNCNHFFKNPQSNYGKQLIAAVPDLRAKKFYLSKEELKPILEINNLKIHFPIKKGIFKKTVGYVKAVDNISFELIQGETLALVGQSGSGKSTAAMAILSLIEKTAGTELFDKRIIHKNKKKSIAYLRKNMQVIFQDPYASLNPRRLVYDSIIEGLFAQKKISKSKDALELVDRLLDQVHLPRDAKWHYPHEFSGGEKQRICIARALTLKPKLLILDEPTSSLDVTVQMQVLKLFEDLQTELGLSYFLITHNLGVVAHIAHRMLVMYQGKIVERGATKDVLENPNHSYTKKLLASMPVIKSSSN